LGKQKINAVSLQSIPFEKLVFLENNPRTRTPDGLERMASDIKGDPTFYQNRPTLVNLVGGVFYVYAGDLRAHAAHHILGWAEIPCNVESDVPADVQKRRAILDNTHREGWGCLGGRFCGGGHVGCRSRFTRGGRFCDWGIFGCWRLCYGRLCGRLPG
jgi:hypothetical protein